MNIKNLSILSQFQCVNKIIDEDFIFSVIRTRTRSSRMSTGQPGWATDTARGQVGRAVTLGVLNLIQET